MANTASNFLTTPFPYDEAIYGSIPVVVTTGAIGSGFSATVVVSQAVLGSIGATESAKEVTNISASGEIGDQTSGLAITKYTSNLSANISASGFASINKQYIGLTEDADAVFHTQIVGAHDQTEWAESVNPPGQDVLTEYALFVVPFFESFYSQLTANISASEASTITHQATSGEIGDSLSGKVNTTTNVSGEIGDSVSSASTISQSAKGEIGDATSVTIITNEKVKGEIGSIQAGRAQTGDFDTTPDVAVSVRVKVVINDIVSGEIGSSASGVSSTGQKVRGAIGNTIKETSNLISQAVKGFINGSERGQITNAVSVTGEIGDSLAGVVRTNEVVTGTIGTTQAVTNEIISQAVRGEIGDQFTVFVTTTTNAVGSIGVKESGKALRLSIVEGNIHTLQTPSKKTKLKTWAKNVLLRTVPEA